MRMWCCENAETWKQLYKFWDDASKMRSFVFRIDKFGLKSFLHVLYVSNAISAIKIILIIMPRRGKNEVVIIDGVRNLTAVTTFIKIKTRFERFTIFVCKLLLRHA